MTEASDPVTVALTGQLPFYLLLAGVLTWPIAIGLLRLYTRAVRRSMRMSTPGAVSAIAIPPLATAPIEARQGEPGSTASFHDLPNAATSPEADMLLGRLTALSRRAALVYAIGGSAYALVMASAHLLAGGLEILPVRFLFLFWVFVWPVVLTVGIVAVATRPARFALTAAYFIGLSALGAIGMLSSPDLTWGQVFLLWILSDLPPTILLMTYLSRRVRAVGPLVLTFMFLALTGTGVAVSIAGSRVSSVRTIVNLAGSVGLGGTGALVALLAVGFLAFAAVGWATLAWIGRRYQAKKISDETVTVDAIWMLFAVVHSIGLVFEHPLWLLTSLAAFGAYKACVRVGFSWLGRQDELSQKSPTLLVLRSFSIGRDGERLFEFIERLWRRAGSIQMITGVDLALRTVEPHEFLDFISGKLTRRFIDASATLEQRLRERDMRPDRDLRFRVNDFFCYDDTWKMVLSRLVHESDAVLMDLRGFSRDNAGCVFELHELVRLVPLDRVVFVVDRRTDETLLAETLGDCRAGVYRLGSMDGRQLRQLLRALAAAAAPTPAVVA
jgi:hypothetical protein